MHIHKAMLHNLLFLYSVQTEVLNEITWVDPATKTALKETHHKDIQLQWS